MLLREILDWRLAQYLSRAGGTEDIICRVSRNTSGNPILFLPSIGSGGSLPEGSMDIEVDGRPLEAIVAKIAINVLRDPSGGGNQLPTILRSWFGEDAGLPGRADRVRIRRNANVAVMEPIGASAHPTSGLQLWQRYLREVIPPAFGMPFNRGIWNVGFVTSPAHILLLVTLKKDDANPEHKYADHFLSDRQFNWQSQNRTTQNSKPGQMIRDHKARGLHVHLLVRPSKKISQGGAPFIYCGEVDYVSWEGNAPITVLWRLREPVPPTLWSTLNVPA
jgi:hypothetical protein